MYTLVTNKTSRLELEQKSSEIDYYLRRFISESMKKVFKFSSQVWKWPGDMGWHFVTLPKKLSGEIGKIGKRYGAGFIKVKVTLRKSSWVTALFPHKESGAYLLSIKQNIRKKEGVWEGDTIKASLTLE